MPDIIHELRINVSLKHVCGALTTKDGLSKWWTKDTVAAREVDSVAEFGFGRRSTVIRMQIEALHPPRKVRWRCLGGIDEWEHTMVWFDLARQNQQTVLLFRHLGWRSTEGVFAICIQFGRPWPGASVSSGVDESA